MRTILTLTALMLFGCLADDATIYERTSEAHGNSVLCEDGDPCITSGGNEGVCVSDVCATQCESSDDCHGSDCRVGHCLNGLCAFVGVPNGESCTANGSMGECVAGTCSVD